MNKRNKILPIFIVCAFLMFTVKVGNIIKKDFSFSIAQNYAVSQEVEEVDLNVPVVGEGDNFSQIEVEILQDLAKRRELLDAKAKELDGRAFQLDVAKGEMDKKIEQMKSYEQKLSNLVDKYNAQEREKMANLVKIYTTMKPKDAANIFNNLDMDVLEMLFAMMKPSSSSAILSQMNPNVAKDITLRIVGNKVK